MKFNLDRLIEDFENHLKPEDNNRIIFSGAFGTGKTFFLDNFFLNNSEYEAIHLYPVNYSVSPTEDIFELIKYDILFSLLGRDVELENINIPIDVFLPYFFQSNQFNIAAHLLGYVPKVGGLLKESAEKIIELKKQFDKDYKNTKESEFDNIVKYLEKFKTIKGNLYEEDYFTQLICKLVEQIKENKKKKNVLIIDDLDRIDPDHIFRIFNILAAHLDISKVTNQNKFNFDKIILVCDIENIRKIFANRYGMNVDFSGYIDKFYSKSIYPYNLSFEIEERFRDILEHTPDLRTNSNFSSNTIYILLAFLQYNLLPVRVLLRNLDSEIKTKRLKVYTDNEFRKDITNNEIELISTIYFLKEFFQSYEALISNCKFLIGKEIKNPLNISIQLLVSELISAISFKKYHKNTINIRDESENLSLSTPKYIFYYSIKRLWNSENISNDNYKIELKDIKSNSTKIKLSDIDYFELLTWVLEESKFSKVVRDQF
ncbi:KAP family P-loop domain-containing protein [Algoriphagus locisalis]|uniref:KAP family P-loop domain-containing protein n=1 Tax=Algoriphagus locisalis TaxID=305507 RepID=A0A1I6YLJ4_9BACT|nr:P-loop NTPase fold protein [Algoriphagus locisalis]SFT51349.1 KAP family P-loop domain-containing protein [Algoriphagus locisalis]